MPVYDLKLSARFLGQSKALEWLALSAKGDFDDEHIYRLAQWGVKKSHTGTCVLISKDWKNIDPMDLIDLFDLQASSQATRLRYQYADHCTAYARALAWFSQWPRTGLQLDNFLGNGPYKPMDASHNCHHDTCIIHITYEAAHINHSRKACCDFARKLRREGKEEELPEQCDKHDPPCLLQVSNAIINRIYKDSHVTSMLRIRPTRFSSLSLTCFARHEGFLRSHISDHGGIPTHHSRRNFHLAFQPSLSTQKTWLTNQYLDEERESQIYFASFAKRSRPLTVSLGSGGMWLTLMRPSIPLSVWKRYAVLRRYGRRTGRNTVMAASEDM